MRNLKKILALVLALMMTLSLMVTASATSYKDDDSIQYDEAVTVMSAIGVFNGTGGGNFSPNGTLKRDQAAKIIAFMMMGKGANELPNDAATFSDVGKYWGNGPIAWCASEGIVNGVGDNKFSPNREVTGYEFGKMLLNAAGVEGKYTGGNWQINVAAALTKNNITTGMTGLTLSKPLTREQACQMAFKAMQISPNGTKSTFVVTENSTGIEVYRGTDALQALAMSNANGGTRYTLGIANTYDGSLSDVMFNLENKDVKDVFGRNIKTWKYQGPNGAEIYKAPSNPTKSYTTTVSYDKIAADLGGKAGENFSFTVYTNGSNNKTTQTAAKGTTTAMTASGNGVLVEVYQTGDTTADVFIINTYVDKIATVNPAVAATDTPANIVLTNPAGGTALTFDTTAFKVNDVVLYTVANGAVATVEKAPYVSGTVTAHYNAYLYIRVNNGKPMYLAKENENAKAAGFKIGTTPGYTYVAGGNEYTYYLDNYGYIMMAEQGYVAPVEQKFVYVISRASVGGANSGNILYGDATTDKATARAQIMDLSTGKVSVVDQAVVKTASGWDYANSNGGASGTPVVTVNGDDGKAGTPKTDGHIYTYTVLADGTYVLDTTQKEEGAPGNITLQTGVAAIEAAGGRLATASTKVTVLTHSADFKNVAKKEYVGYANFPASLNDSTAKILVSSKTVGASTVATSIVFVVAETDAITAPTYAIYAGPGETDETGSSWAFYVDGKETNYYLASGVTDTQAGVKGLTVGDVVTVKLTGGKLAANAVAAATAGKTGVADYQEGDGYLAIDSVAYYFASGCKTVDATGKTTTVKDGDTVDLYLNATTQKVEFIVVK